jgi:hypothetical protein
MGGGARHVARHAGAGLWRGRCGDKQVTVPVWLDLPTGQLLGFKRLWGQHEHRLARLLTQRFQPC